MLGPKSSIARYSKWGSWPYPYIAGMVGCPWRSWSILLSYRRMGRWTLCDTRDFLSATVRPEFASTAWKTRPWGRQWWHQWGCQNKDGPHMRQSQELVRGDRSGVGAWDGMGFRRWDYGLSARARDCPRKFYIIWDSQPIRERVSSGGKGKLTWKYLAHDALIDVLTPASKVS